VFWLQKIEVLVAEAFDPLAVFDGLAMRRFLHLMCCSFFGSHSFVSIRRVYERGRVGGSRCSRCSGLYTLWWCVEREVVWVGDVVPEDGGGEEVGGWVEVVLYV
jgi:hypothetical protein